MEACVIGNAAPNESDPDKQARLPQVEKQLAEKKKQVETLAKLRPGIRAGLSKCSLKKKKQSYPEGNVLPLIEVQKTKPKAHPPRQCP